jgi:hypothetical protein
LHDLHLALPSGFLCLVPAYIFEKEGPGWQGVSIEQAEQALLTLLCKAVSTDVLFGVALPTEQCWQSVLHGVLLDSDSCACMTAA